MNRNGSVQYLDIHTTKFVVLFMIIIDKALVSYLAHLSYCGPPQLATDYCSSYSCFLRPLCSASLCCRFFATQQTKTNNAMITWDRSIVWQTLLSCFSHWCAGYKCLCNSITLHFAGVFWQLGDIQKAR